MYEIDPCTPRSLKSKISPATTPTADRESSAKVVAEVCTPMRLGDLRETVASKTQPCIPQSPYSVKKRPVTPSLKLLTPLKPMTPTFPFSPSTSTFSLSSRLKHLLVSPRSRANSWPDITPECARALEWDTVLEYRSPYSKNKWEFVSPLGGSPAKRLFSWAFEGQLELEYVGCPGVIDEVFALTDLDQQVTHELTAKDFEFLPSVI